MSPHPALCVRSFWKMLACLAALPLAALAEENAADLSKIKPVGGQNWDEATLLASAEARIQQHRTGDAAIRVLDRDGRPLAHAEVRVRLVAHEFKLGCNAFLLSEVVGPTIAPAMRQQYEDRFAALLNYATLPFYWGFYEAEPGHEKDADVRQMAAWCRAHHIAVKGHPLAWHEVFPEWAKSRPDAEVLQLQRERISRIVESFKGTVDIFDAINEATVSARFDNAIGRWVKSQGAASVVAEVLDRAHAANPQATLLYNDFNVSADFEKLVADLQARHAPMDVIGIQSHMHKEHWPIEKAWAVCETYARFGRPLHFTELTILSGKFKDKDDNDWHTNRVGWESTPEGEQRQLEYGRKLYTLLFSHPAVEAITWWDFSDLQSWTRAPAGLLRKDMSPKPLYLWLMDAFHHRWSTDVVVRTDEAGVAKVHGFYGDYEVTPQGAAAAERKARVSFLKRGANQLTVTLP